MRVIRFNKESELISLKNSFNSLLSIFYRNNYQPKIDIFLDLIKQRFYENKIREKVDLEIVENYIKNLNEINIEFTLTKSIEYLDSIIPKYKYKEFSI